MILPTPELMLAVVATLLSMWCAVTVAATRTRTAPAPLEPGVEPGQNSHTCLAQCRQVVETALKEFTTSDQNAPLADPTRDTGRLHRTARTRALKLIRSGASTESVAATLEMPRREVVLLARVASILAR